VADRRRTFRPNYLSFAGTYQCNLACPHCCVPIEWTDRLPIPVALRFLEDAHAHGIEVLGFTGGEPFLYPEFVVAVTRRAAELGFRFDKLMTNGAWHRDARHLATALADLRDAGFGGKLGLSVDKFHGMDIPKLAEFCRAARRVFGKDTIVSLSYASRHLDQGLEPIRRLAQALDAVIDWSAVLGRYLLVSDHLTMTLNWNHLAAVERAESLKVQSWDGVWFEEDYCEGPGQALIVNPRGEVKPCCGFASDLDQLTIGNVHTDTVGRILEAGRNHPFVGRVFRDGLSAIRDDILSRDPTALPGATSNHCFFCWHVLSTGLAGVPGSQAEKSSAGRLSLPMAAETPGPWAAADSSLLMAFDGRTVFLKRLGPAKPQPCKGRVYRIDITGPGRPPEPPGELSWPEYQSWLDRMRAEGYTLTTRTT
jgi:hypothetical protein